MTGPKACRLLTAYLTLKKEGFDPGVPDDVLKEWRRLAAEFRIAYKADLEALGEEQRADRAKGPALRVDSENS